MGIGVGIKAGIVQPLFVSHFKIPQQLELRQYWFKLDDAHEILSNSVSL